MRNLTASVLPLTGSVFQLVADYPSGMRLDAIAKFTGNEIKRAHLDENGKLTED